MKNIVLDGTNWKTENDFYDAFFKAVGAPIWHGRNFNALRDSITAGQMNEIELPYKISIFGFHNTPPDVRGMVSDFCDLIAEFRTNGYAVDVDCRAD
jgi:RNAse (barnase) inhibitor barstar